MNPQEKIAELTDLLNQANYRYYVLDDPQMLDFDPYDYQWYAKDGSKI